jgi:protein tyrosine phosphatase (PTP) superfamily phosphohydrolase (DUF442 family)
MKHNSPVKHRWTLAACIRTAWMPAGLLGMVFILAAAEKTIETPMVRPVEWAQPVLGTKLDNFFRVDTNLFRSEQPGKSDIPALKAMDVKTVLSLRHYHKDSKEFEKAGIRMLHYKMDAGSVSVSNLVAVLKMIQEAPKPVLVHCLHGSDRTGFIVAGYRMVMMGWSPQQAVEELRSGGYGYHKTLYPDIANVLLEMDAASVSNAVHR